MQELSSKISALVGSRICHDLISPIGAISNGLELLELANSVVPGSPEMALIADSCTHAQARIRYFRIAFGTADSAQRVPDREINSIISQMQDSGRVSISWCVDGDQSRRIVQLCFLAIMCVETALPQGGAVTVDFEDRLWKITAAGPTLSVNDALWQAFDGQADRVEATPAQVQFPLLALLAQDSETGIGYSVQTDKLVVTLRPPPS